jgi:hypothetical protein
LSTVQWWILRPPVPKPRSHLPQPTPTANSPASHLPTTNSPALHDPPAHSPSAHSLGRTTPPAHVPTTTHAPPHPYTHARTHARTHRRSGVVNVTLSEPRRVFPAISESLGVKGFEAHNEVQLVPVLRKASSLREASRLEDLPLIGGCWSFECFVFVCLVRHSVACARVICVCASILHSPVMQESTCTRDIRHVITRTWCCTATHLRPTLWPLYSCCNTCFV